MNDMPWHKYIGKQKVKSAKIRHVLFNPNRSFDVFFEDDICSHINISRDVSLNRTPYIGAYVVVSENEEISIEDSDYFERNFTIS